MDDESTGGLPQASPRSCRLQPTHHRGARAAIRPPEATTNVGSTARYALRPHLTSCRSWVSLGRGWQHLMLGVPCPGARSRTRQAPARTGAQRGGLKGQFILWLSRRCCTDQDWRAEGRPTWSATLRLSRRCA